MVDELRQHMHAMGADIFGTSDAGSCAGERFSRTPYAITLGIRLSGAVMDEVENGPTQLYFHHYRTANAFLDRCAMACVIWLQRKGRRALAIPASQTTSAQGIAADFSHKAAANLAGLGFVGKSSLFVTEDYGPRVRLVTVLTDHALPSGQLKPSACGSCDACVRACPCGAILGNSFVPGSSRESLVDAALCSHYMKEKFKMIGRGAVCGICAAVCPFGKQSAQTE